MSSASAKSAVLGCVIGAGAIAAVDSVSKGQRPPLRIGVGMFVAGGFLLALADAAPELAAGFGAVIIVGAVLTQGIPAAQSLVKSLS